MSYGVWTTWPGAIPAYSYPGHWTWTLTSDTQQHWVHDNQTDRLRISKA